jgi:hypothetical protein
MELTKELAISLLKISDTFKIPYDELIACVLGEDDNQEKTTTCTKLNTMKCLAKVKKLDGKIEQCSRSQKKGCSNMCQAHYKQHLNNTLKYGMYVSNIDLDIDLKEQKPAEILKTLPVDDINIIQIDNIEYYYDLISKEVYDIHSFRKVGHLSHQGKLLKKI